MHVVIDISKELLHDIKNYYCHMRFSSPAVQAILPIMLNAIYKGTPLQKGQGIETEWIPVSERLPEPFQDILVTSEDFHWANEPVSYSVKQECFSGSVNFIAWMPLPQHYKASGKEPKKGYWIKTLKEDITECMAGSGYVFMCPKCKKWENHPKRFCPNCGAEIFESHESEGEE